MTRVAPRGNEEVLLQVRRKGNEDRARVAAGVLCIGDVAVEAGDGFADGIGGALGGTLNPATVEALKFGDGFEFAEGFLFDGF